MKQGPYAQQDAPPPARKAKPRIAFMAADPGTRFGELRKLTGKELPTASSPEPRLIEVGVFETGLARRDGG